MHAEVSPAPDETSLAEPREHVPEATLKDFIARVPESSHSELESAFRGLGPDTKARLEQVVGEICQPKQEEEKEKPEEPSEEQVVPETLVEEAEKVAEETPATKVVDKKTEKLVKPTEETQTKKVADGKAKKVSGHPPKKRKDEDAAKKKMESEATKKAEEEAQQKAEEEAKQKEANPEAEFLAAAAEGNDKVVQKLLKSGVNINAIDADGKTALHIAAEKGWEEIVGRLSTGKRVKVNLKTTTSKETPLHFACREGHKDCAVMIVRGGGDVKVKNKSGQTPGDLAQDKQLKTWLALANPGQTPPPWQGQKMR